MATPTIKIDQPTPGPGTAGQSRDDLILSELVTLTDPANLPGDSYVWTMLARPEGSAAVLAGAATPTATFTPDVAGTYLIRVVVNGTDDSGSVDAIGQFISSQGGCGVALPNGVRIPAATETIQFGPNGWAARLDPTWRDIDANLPSSAEKAGLINLPTADQKSDLVQLDGAAEGVIWYANASGRVTRLAAGAAGQVLKAAGVAPPLWEGAPGTLMVEAETTSTTNISSTTDVTISGMDVTTGVAGNPNALVLFSCSASLDTNNATLFLSLYIDGVQVGSTQRRLQRGGAGADIQGVLALHKHVAALGSAQTVQIRGRVAGGGSAAITERVLTVMRAS